MRSPLPLLCCALLLTIAITLLARATPEQAAPKPPARTVLVTGANRGLGLEFAKQYRAAGWNVIGTARKPQDADELRATGAEVVQLDVADAKSVASLAADLSGRSLDMLINNAGVGGRTESLEQVDFGEVARVFAVNTLGPMRITQALLPNLRAGSRKTVVSITSNLGSLEQNTSGHYYGYRESKAALNMFTRSLAAELKGEGFTCIVMSPGWVRTGMGGDAAPLSPEQSITGMRGVIDKLTPADTGKFYRYDGSIVPW
jgi:NAD(P)-dependent dehydrogenase (short-subunit alcohol dehydrogenase family)